MQLERFPIECRKTKIKVIVTLVNCNRCKQHNEAIRGGQGKTGVSDTGTSHVPYLSEQGREPTTISTHI